MKPSVNTAGAGENYKIQPAGKVVNFLQLKISSALERKNLVSGQMHAFSCENNIFLLAPNFSWKEKCLLWGAYLLGMLFSGRVILPLLSSLITVSYFTRI